MVSLFSRAFNVLHPRGLLVGVVAAPEQMSPFALLAEGLFRAEGGVAPGARIAKGAMCRRTSSGLIVSGMRLDLSGSRPWDGRLPPGLMGSIADPSSLAALLRAAIAAAGAEDGLREIVVPGSSGTIFARRAREILASAHNGEDGRREKLRGLSGFVGLGIGFTPSGDDFISGVLLAREMTGRGGPELDEQEIRSALDRTNDGGRTLLTGVLSRCFPAYLLEFAGAIAASIRSSSSGGAAVERSVQDAVRAAAAHGETSGTDAVTGFAWYLGLLGRRQQPPA